MAWRGVRRMILEVRYCVRLSWVGAFLPLTRGKRLFLLLAAAVGDPKLARWLRGPFPRGGLVLVVLVVCLSLGGDFLAPPCIMFGVCRGTHGGGCHVRSGIHDNCGNQSPGVRCTCTVSDTVYIVIFGSANSTKIPARWRFSTAKHTVTRDRRWRGSQEGSQILSGVVVWSTGSSVLPGGSRV